MCKETYRIHAAVVLGLNSQMVRQGAMHDILYALPRNIEARHV